MERDAMDLIDLVETRAAELADALATEQRLEDERALVKRAAILRLLATANDLTGKPHSASSAAEVVELDEQYAAHRRAQSVAVVARQTAWGRYEAARLRAQLAVNLATVPALVPAGV